MKNILFLFLFFGGLSSLMAQDRNTIWLYGFPPTSGGWNSSISLARTIGWDFTVANTFGYPLGGMPISNVGEAMNNTIAGMDDVLGIGHDAGGIVLRSMAQNPDSKLSAMILVGTPNQGMGVLDKLLSRVPTDPGYKSDVERMIEQLKGLKSAANDCQDCLILDAFEGWAKEIKNNQSDFEELLPNSPTMTNLGAPTIPTAVIWGDATTSDGLSITRLLGSLSQVGLKGDDRAYLECYQDAIQDRLNALQLQTLNAQVDALLSVASFISKTVKITGSTATNPVGEDISGDVSANLIALVNDLKNAAIKIKEIDLALSEVFECELVHQALNANWNFMVSSQYELTSTGVAGGGQFAQCCEECYDDFNEPDGDIIGAYCLSTCAGGPPYPSLPGFCYVENPALEYYYTQVPHDGVLTRDEQLLGGAVKTYRAKANHIQEIFWVTPDIASAFNDLFAGNAGPAFAVPQ